MYFLSYFVALYLLLTNSQRILITRPRTESKQAEERGTTLSPVFLYRSLIRCLFQMVMFFHEFCDYVSSLVLFN